MAKQSLLRLQADVCSEWRRKPGDLEGHGGKLGTAFRKHGWTLLGDPSAWHEQAGTDVEALLLPVSAFPGSPLLIHL